MRRATRRRPRSPCRSPSGGSWGKLRNETFFSLGSLNARIREQLADLNARVMKRYGKSRAQLFAEIEKPVLLPLPSARFEYGEWSSATVNIDYHVAFDHHLYSVPHVLAEVHEKVEIRATEHTVEITSRSKRVASHVRSRVRGGFSTNPGAHAEQPPRARGVDARRRILAWAEKVPAQRRARALSRRSCSSVRIPSRAFARASASCD